MGLCTPEHYAALAALEVKVILGSGIKTTHPPPLLVNIPNFIGAIVLFKLLKRCI